MMSNARPKKDQVEHFSSKLPRGTGTDHVYLMLRNMIVRMELAPGNKIDEAAMSVSLGVSRTPLREALVRLHADKLVVISANRGAHVAPLDALELTNYFEALTLTHRALQHWACLRRTPSDLQRINAARLDYEKATITRDPQTLSEANLEFHIRIADASKNFLFRDFCMKLSILGMRIGWILYNKLAEEPAKVSIEKTVEEHRLIYKSIEDRAAEESELLAQLHIDAFRDRIFSSLSETLGAAIPITR